MLPSPKDHDQVVIVPSGSMLRVPSTVMDAPVGAVVEDGVKLATGGLSEIETCEEVDAVDPLLSVTVNVIV